MNIYVNVYMNIYRNIYRNFKMIILINIYMKIQRNIQINIYLMINMIFNMNINMNIYMYRIQSSQLKTYLGVMDSNSFYKNVKTAKIKRKKSNWTQNEIFFEKNLKKIRL